LALNPKVTKRSLDNAFAMAQASGLAYAVEAEIRVGLPAAIGAAPLDLKIFAIPSHNTSVFMALFDESIVVSFRGTIDAENWLTNIQVALVPFRGGGLIHFGFREALDTVFPQMSDVLQAWSGKGRTLWITGHSLGGALALLLGAYLRFPADPTKTLPRPIAGLYTFGQPRVGTHDFCDACDTNFGNYYFRYVNNRDIVTRVPPRVLSYWHIDSVEYITSEGVINDDPAWWQIFLDAVAAGFKAVETLKVATPIVAIVKDHAINNYIRLIGAVVNQAPTPAVPVGV
jgi:triacylglycerol lipase